MANSDPFEKYAVDSAPDSSSANSDSFEKYAVGTPSRGPTTPQSLESDPFASYATKSPLTGQTDQSPKFDYQDPNKTWYERGWSWLQTPLTESLFGLPETRPGAGGFERGIERVASGLTSPLSVGLTAATLGGGGLIESAGTTALKESGEFAVSEIPQIMKASEAAIQATKDLKPIEPFINDALRAKGGDGLVDLVNKAKLELGPIDLSDKFGEEEVQKNLAKAGFSEDEIKDLSSASKTIQKANQDFSPVEDAVKATGVDPALWKRAQATLYNNGLTEQDLLGGNAVERGAFQILRKAVPDLPIATSVRAAKTANVLLNTGFTLQQLEVASQMSPRFLDALKEGDYDSAKEYGTEMLAGAGLGILGTSHALHSAGELFNPLLESNKLRPNDQWRAIEKVNETREADHAVGEQEAITLRGLVRQTLGHTEPRPILGDTTEVKSQRALENESVYHQIVTGGDQNKAAHWYNTWSQADGRENRLPVTGTPQDNGLPENLDDILERNKFKSQSAEYKNLALESMRRVAQGELSGKELAAAKLVKDEQDRNLEIGQNNDLLHGHVEDYMTRIYKDENPDGKVLLSNIKAGKLATNVTMARQRMYDSHPTAMLLSPKEMDFDVANNVAQGRAQLIKAGANRQLLDTLRDNNVRGSDGRPAVVLSGQGQVITGQNGEDPKIFIDPNRVRKINISDNVVQQLTKSGDLQRFLDEGTIRDITPYVHPQNISAAISRLEEQSIGQNAKYDEVGNNKLRTQIMYLKSMLANKDYSGLKEFNDGIEKSYAWDPQDYISLDNGALKGWNFTTNSSDGAPIFVRSDIRIHPEFAEYLKNRLGLEPSAVASNPIGKALLTAGTKTKKLLLKLSPFHTVQIGLRGIMTGVNPFTLNGPDIIDGAKVDPSDPYSPTKLRKMVERGYTTGTDYKALQEHSEGLSSGYIKDKGLLRRIPGIGPIIANSMNAYESFLFKRYIPAIKATAAEHLFDLYKESHPDWSIDRVAKAAALHSNENFGGINWRAMGRSATTQDWGRVFSLAPDWLESELRAGARLFNRDEGNVGRKQIVLMTMGLWGISRVLNLMTTGQMHPEAPFGVSVTNREGKEVVYGLRNLPQDLLHAASDPVSFLKGRLSPTVHFGQEILSGRDNFGRKLAPEDLWADATRNLLPIPIQSIGQAITSTGPQVGNAGQLWKGSGGSAQVYETPAAKLAAEMSANHTEDGPIDPAQMARHRTIMEFEDKVRSGEMSMPDIYKMYAMGQLHEDDLKKISENIKKTKEMPAPLASLYTRASRLPGDQYLQLYDQMNPAEKTALLPLTQQVRKRYIAKAMKNLRPEERLKDPVFVRYLNLVPEQSPF